MKPYVSAPPPAGNIAFNRGGEGFPKAVRAVLQLYDDCGGVQAPADCRIEAWTGDAWKEVAGQMKNPAVPTGSMANVVTFPAVGSAKFRVVFTHQGNARSGLTELGLWED